MNCETPMKNVCAIGRGDACAPKRHFRALGRLVHMPGLMMSKLVADIFATLEMRALPCTFPELSASQRGWRACWRSVRVGFERSFQEELRAGRFPVCK